MFLSTPPQDWFETTLDQFYNWGLGTMHVKDVPLITFPTGKKVYITIDAKKTTMQVVEVDGWDSTAKTMNVSSITTERGDGLAYTAQDHWIGASVQISDPYEVRKNIEDAIGNIDSGTVKTNSQDIADGKFADPTARDAYFTSPVNGNSAYVTSLGLWTDYIAGAWTNRATGSTPNATEASSGKGQIATQLQITNGDATSWGNPLWVAPDKLKVVTDLIKADVFSQFALFSQFAFGSWSDWDVTIAGTVTLTRDMFYNNLVIPSGQTLNPNGYRFFVKGTISGTGSITINGNNGAAGGNNIGAGGTGGAGGAALNQGTINFASAGGAGGNGGNGVATPSAAGTSKNPSLTNVNWVAGGAWGSGVAGAGVAAGAGGVSTRWDYYNQVFPMGLLHPATQGVVLNYLAGATSSGGTWWTGAGWGASSAGWGGGGAGSNGGTVRCAVKIWNFTGVVSLVGGNGGNGGYGGFQGWGGGGGAGGNGGILLRIYHTLINDATITLTGGTPGTGGAGGSGSPSALPGASGTAGNTGVTISIVI